MSIILLGLAIDEFLALHEEINSRPRPLGVHTVLCGCRWRCLRPRLCPRLLPDAPSAPSTGETPVHPRRVIYLSGAVVLETVGGHYVTVWGHSSMKYVLCTAAEEFLEMLGIVVLIYALLRFLTQDGREILLTLEVHNRIRSRTDRS